MRASDPMTLPTRLVLFLLMLSVLVLLLSAAVVLGSVFGGLYVAASGCHHLIVQTLPALLGLLKGDPRQ